MKKFRILTLASILAAAGMMTGCDLFGSDSSSNTSPTVSETRLDNATLTADGTSATTIRGIVSDDAAGLKVTFKVLNSANADKTSDFDITFTQVPSADKDWSIGDPAKGKGSIKAKTTAANGTYTLVITVTDADGASTSANVTMTVTGGSTQPTTLKDTTVTLGSFSAAPPSWLDVDAMITYASKDDVAKTNAASIDLGFFNEAAGGVFFMSPSYAAGQSQNSTTWSVKNTTKMVKVTSDFASLNTQAAIDALWESKKADALERIPLTVGAVVLVKGNSGVVAVKVETIPTEGNAATCTVKGYK